MFMATKEKVGIPARRVIIEELLAERAGLQVDRRGDNIITHSASSRGSSIGSLIFLDDSINSDANNGIANEDCIAAN